LVSASGHQSNTSSIKGIFELVTAVVWPASAKSMDSGGPGGAGFIKARMVTNDSWIRVPWIPENFDSE